MVFGGIGVRSSWIYMSSIFDFRRFMDQCTRFFDFWTRVFDKIAKNRLVLAKIDKIEHIFCTFRAEDFFHSSTLKWWKIFEKCPRFLSKIWLDPLPSELGRRKSYVRPCSVEEIQMVLQKVNKN